MIVLLGVAFWLACGVIEYARCFAYFQRRFPLIAADQYEDDRRFALWGILGGPFTLAGGILQGGFRYGLKFK